MPKGSFRNAQVIDPRKLAEFLRSPNGPVFREMLVAGDVVKARAKELVGVSRPDPVPRRNQRRPGTLRDSIVKRVVTRGGQPAVQVGSEDKIALLHHEGTDPHEIVPKRKPRLVFFSNRAGATVYALRVSHPGTRPNPFLRNALEALRGRYRQ